MKKKKIKEEDLELVSISEYARRKGMSRSAVKDKVSAGKIEKQVIAELPFIDWEKYKDFEFRSANGTKNKKR